MYQVNPPLSPRETLPTMYDLPSEDSEECGVPDEFHSFQPEQRAEQEKQRANSAELELANLKRLLLDRGIDLTCFY